ncbi:MAG: N-acetylmuramoyl-L-alanine amidase family protein, partial [Thermoplasmata archaeon]
EMPLALLADANPGRQEVRSGSWYRIPISLLSVSWRERTIRSLFPADGPVESGWVHRPAACVLDTYGEGAWEVALWFTGDGRNFEAILRSNGLTDPILARGNDVIIPAHLLLEPFRLAWERWLVQADVKETDHVEQGTEAAAGKAARARPPELTFSKDDEGEYALYRLKRGEALYSAVVVRFTGRIEPDDVAEAAALIANRSGIRLVTEIPVGYFVKIPRSMLLPEFLPPTDRKRKAVEIARREAENVKNPVQSRHLEGIHVILDAGHGGVDPGALIAGVAEHEYAYDLMCRVKTLLETESSAIVHPIIEDPAIGFAPRSARILRAQGGETILTTPVHVNGDPGETSLGVNLRWYLANSIARGLVNAGVDPSRTVFASFHADVLHPSLRGAMVYVPGERYRRGTYVCPEEECLRYGAVREAPRVRFSRAERVASEGLSREFAAGLMRAFAKRGIRVHPYQPVRDRIIRNGRAWLPAVLRGNRVPVKILIEMGNMNNPADRRLIQDPSFRQSVARAFVDALLGYYKS